MAEGFGFGGNSFAITGSIPLSPNPVMIPFPITNTLIGATNTLVSGVARLTVTAPSSEDLYIGPLGDVQFRVPANTTAWFTVRVPLWVANAPNNASSLSSNSSSSSSNATATSSMSYFYEWN